MKRLILFLIPALMVICTNQTELDENALKDYIANDTILFNTSSHYEGKAVSDSGDTVPPTVFDTINTVLWGREITSHPDPEIEIEIVGDDIGGLNLKFRVRDTFASRGQKAIYWGRLRPMERILLRSSLVPWSYLASRLYHDYFWYPFIGRKRIVRIEKTGWYRLFQSYG